MFTRSSLKYVKKPLKCQCIISHEHESVNLLKFVPGMLPCIIKQGWKCKWQYSEGHGKAMFLFFFNLFSVAIYAMK